MVAEKAVCPPHHWIVTIEERPAKGRVYAHRCTRCKLAKDQPIRDESPKKWRGTKNP